MVTNSKGFEKVDTGSTATVKSDREGKATITFAEPGWHRIKATVAGAVVAAGSPTPQRFS